VIRARVRSDSCILGRRGNANQKISSVMSEDHGSNGLATWHEGFQDRIAGLQWGPPIWGGVLSKGVAPPRSSPKIKL
jgi:hypothetical protein